MNYAIEEAMMEESNSSGKGRGARNSTPSTQEIADTFKEPSAKERADFARRRELGLGVGLDDSGRIVTGKSPRT